MPACRLATALLAVCCNFCLQSSTIAAKCNKLYDDQLCFNYAQQMDHHHDSKVGTWLLACGRLFIIDQILAASQGFMSTLCRGHRTHDSSLDVCCCHPYRKPGDSAYFREPFNLDATCFAQKCCTLGNREPACTQRHHVPCLSFHDRLDLRFSQGYTGLQHSFHRAGAAHPHLPHRVGAPPHLEFGRSPSGCGENFNLLSI